MAACTASSRMIFATIFCFDFCARSVSFSNWRKSCSTSLWSRTKRAMASMQEPPARTVCIRNATRLPARWAGEGRRPSAQLRQLLVDLVGAGEGRDGLLERIGAPLRGRLVAVLRLQPPHLVKRPRLPGSALQRARERALRPSRPAEPAHRAAQRRGGPRVVGTHGHHPDDRVKRLLVASL